MGDGAVKTLGTKGAEGMNGVDAVDFGLKTDVGGLSIEVVDVGTEGVYDWEPFLSEPLAEDILD